MHTYRYFIKLAYNGANYHGWQEQKNAPSVQQTITNAMNDILGRKISLTGCGRTDTGVHATEYYAHFEVEEEIGGEGLEHLNFRLNSYLPKDIAIYDIYPVEAGMHARFSALSRTYKYYIHTRKDPFLLDNSWFVYGLDDIEIMNRGSKLLLEYEDFTSFSKLHTQTKNNICHISHALWEREDHRLIFTITADRFLRNMVRAIVGTLVDLGNHKIDLEGLRKIIESHDRSAAGQSVPAQGLFLNRVVYPG